MLKKMTYAMLVSGLLIASFGASAETAWPDQSDALDHGIPIAGETSVIAATEDSPYPDQQEDKADLIRSQSVIAATEDSPYPDQQEDKADLIRSRSVIAATEDSPFPDQQEDKADLIRSRSVIAATEDSPFPTESDVVDYGLRIAAEETRSPYPTPIETEIVDCGTRAVV